MIKSALNRALILPILVTAAFSFPASAETQVPRDIGVIALEFMNAKNAWQQPKSDVSDIDYLLSFLDDKILDEHVFAGITMNDKDAMRANMIEKLRTEVLYSRLTVNQMIIGADVVIVEYTERGKIKRPETIQPLEYEITNILSLEFTEDRLIHHVRRHSGR